MISIIIPTLNEEKTIERTLAGLEPIRLPHEIIVTDGKSTDRTVDIARRFATVVEFPGGHRQTIAEGRNDGAAKARGEYMAFMDADCSYKDPDAFFRSALECFKKDPRLVGMTVAIRVRPENETWADKLVYICFNSYLAFLNNVLGIGMAAGEFQMIRASAFQQVGGYNPALVASEDIELFYRLGKIGRIRFNSKLTIYHSGRRAHKVGWPRLLWSWFANSVSMMTRKRAHSKEWTVIR